MWLLMVASMFYATPSVEMLQISRVIYFFLSLAFFALLVDIMRKGNIYSYHRFLFFLLFFLGSLEAIIAIGQYFSQQALGLRWLAEPKLNSEHFPRASFYMFDGSKTIWETLFFNRGEGASIMRAYGTFYHPNVLGGFLNVTLVVGYYLFFEVKSKIQKVFVSGFILLQIFAIFITFSRAAIFGSVLSALLWWLFLRKRREKKVVYLFLTGLTLSFFVLFPQIEKRGGIVNHKGIVVASDNERLSTQSIALQIIKSHCFTGIGFSNYTKHAESYYGKGLVVHNIYLLLWAELGLGAVGFFLLFIGSVLRRALLQMHELKYVALTIAVIVLLFLGLFDFYLLFSQSMRLLFFTLSALLCTSSVYVWHWKNRGDQEVNVC
jgi:O-antigen ligase